MIEEGDRIAVGVSGKDSAALLFILWLLKKYSSFNFDFEAISVDLGLGADYSQIKDFCEKHDIPLHIKHTQIGEIIFNVRKESNPCSLCSKFRKGALNEEASNLNFNKVALGHHLDDAIETLLLNVIYTGKLGTFKPKMYLDRTNVTIIRPLVYIPEETIISLVKLENIPYIENPCPVDGHTKRQEMKELVSKLKKRYPDIKQKFLSALQNVNIDDLWVK